MPAPPLRFRQRHVLKTMSLYVQDQMKILGWVDQPRNFGAQPIIFTDLEPQVHGLPIGPNTLAISIGDEGEDEVYEMGDGLRVIYLPFFFDVYGETPDHSIMIASDLKSVLREKLMYVTDFTTNPAVQSQEYMEIEDVEGPIIPEAVAGLTDFARNWRVVKATAAVYFRH